MKEVIFTNKAQNPGSMPYSQAIKKGNMVFVAGQGPFDPDTGQLVGQTIEEQARRTLDNVEAILVAVNSSLDDVVKVTVLLEVGADFDRFNKIYKEYFQE